MPRVVDPKGWEKPYVRGEFEFRTRPVAPKQAAPGAWETALARIAGGQTMPPVYEPLPTTSRLRQKRRAQVQALNGHENSAVERSTALSGDLEAK